MAPEFLPIHRGFGYEVYERPNGAWRWIVFVPSDPEEGLRLGEAYSKADAIEASKNANEAMLKVRDAQS